MSLRIVLAIGELEIGGTQRQMLELAQSLDPQVFSTQVLCLSQSLAFADEFRHAGINVSVVEKRSRYDIAILPRLKKFFRQHGTQVLITFGFTADSWCRVAARMAAIPVVISSVRTSSEETSMIDRVNRALSSFADHYVINSNAIVPYLRRIRVPPEKYSIIHNGLDLSRFEVTSHDSHEVRRSLAIPDSSFVVGIVSRLSPEKNVESFLRLAKDFASSCRDAVFVVVGEGPEEGRLHSLATELNLDANVRWLGGRKDVPRLLRAFDLAMLTSQREGLSNTLLEYLAAGLPVIASNVGGNGEIIQHGRTGFLYPADEPSQALDWMRKLHREPELRKQVAAAASRDVVDRFGVGQLAAKTQDLVLRLWKAKGQSGFETTRHEPQEAAAPTLAKVERRYH
jgi:glycosyltransferase involved in cell wall biosynthesis